MKKYWLCLGASIAVMIGIIGTILYVKNPLIFCHISPYEVEQYQNNGVSYVVASYPLDVRGDNSNFTIVSNIVEKKDDAGNYRTVYDSAKGIIPIREDLVVNNPYSYTVYWDMTLQPLADIYGDGIYRVVQLGKDAQTEDEIMIAKEYYVVSGEHLANQHTVSEVFQISKEDLQHLEIHNMNIQFELTMEEKEKFIDYILNMKTVAMAPEQYRNWALAIRSDSPNLLGDYSMVLNLPNGIRATIYSKIGKNLDGSSYQAIFYSDGTYICLDSEEKLLPLLDNLKQKYKNDNP